MAMFTRSPALHATRPPGLIDPRHPAEYPVLLGESSKQSDHRSTSMVLRYNWKAQKSSTISRTHMVKAKADSGDAYELILEDRLHKDQPYKYAGQASQKASSREAEDEEYDPDQSLALSWDPAKSAFILEPISASLDFNLTSAPDQTQREINAHKKLQRTTSHDAEADPEASNILNAQSSDSDSDPDVSNPYDFRHFLAEAREGISNSTDARSRTPVPGSRTPILGSRTPIPGSGTPIPGSRIPLPGLNSPALGAKTSMPQFHATSGPTVKKRKLERSPAPVRKPAPRRPATSTQPLSSERIVDSDSDSEADVPLANHRKALTALNSPPSHSQQARTSSPHLIVSDASASLEIDLGSPPPEKEKFTQRKRKINPDAFRRNLAKRASPPPEPETADVEMTDADVEELELGSPHAASRAMSMSSAVHGRIEKDANAEEEDDDGLAAELAAALEEEEEEGLVLGLGISTVGKEDESEVSEEE